MTILSRTNPPPEARENINSSHRRALRFLAISFVLLIQFMLTMEMISAAILFVISTFLLSGYLLTEILEQWKLKEDGFWINPVVLASVFMYLIPYGISNILFSLPKHMRASVGIESGITIWMNQLMLLVILGAIMMWTGYNSGIGLWLSWKIKNSKILLKGLNTSTNVKKTFVYTLIIISLAARLLQIKLGIYGYSAITERLTEAVNYREYIQLASAFGKLALMGTALQYFSSVPRDPHNRNLLVLILLYELGFGFLSGFKGAVVTPIVIIGFVYYSQKNKFHWMLLPALSVGIIAAYAVIEPFRDYRNTNINYSGTSVASIATAINSTNWFDSSKTNERASTGLLVLARSNLTYVGSLGIEFSAKQKLPKESPKFLEDTLLAPIYAIVPRFLWRSKSIENTGQWYTTTVVGLDVFSSTAMSPFTYLNFAGGPLAVGIGFFLVGVLQRGIFHGLRRFGGGGTLMLLGMLGVLSQMEHSYSHFLVNFIRLFPMLFLAQYFLMQRSSPSLSAGRFQEHL